VISNDGTAGAEKKQVVQRDPERGRLNRNQKQQITLPRGIIRSRGKTRGSKEIKEELIIEGTRPLRSGFTLEKRMAQKL